MTPVRVIVAEDFDRFRRYICSTLLSRSNVHLVSEISDGLEAVQRTQEMQPDLILLDIGLPSLNGIEAARRIRELAPQTKILFVTQEDSPDVVRKAFNAGGLGYVVKIDAASDLLAAVDVVLRGDIFVPGRFAHFMNDTGLTGP